jgi:hypothetical protein
MPGLIRPKISWARCTYLLSLSDDFHPIPGNLTRIHLLLPSVRRETSISIPHESFGRSLEQRLQVAEMLLKTMVK